MGFHFFRANSDPGYVFDITGNNNANPAAEPYLRLWLALILLVASQLINLFPDYTSLLGEQNHRASDGGQTDNITYRNAPDC